MPQVLLRVAPGGGWEIVIDGNTVVWDANLERAAMTALNLQLSRESTEDIQLGADVPADVLEVARLSITAWALKGPPPSGMS